MAHRLSGDAFHFVGMKSCHVSPCASEYRWGRLVDAPYRGLMYGKRTFGLSKWQRDVLASTIPEMGDPSMLYEREYSIENKLPSL